MAIKLSSARKGQRLGKRHVWTVLSSLEAGFPIIMLYHGSRQHMATEGDWQVRKPKVDILSCNEGRVRKADVMKSKQLFKNPCQVIEFNEAAKRSAEIQAP